MCFFPFSLFQVRVNESSFLHFVKCPIENDLLQKQVVLFVNHGWLLIHVPFNRLVVLGQGLLPTFLHQFFTRFNGFLSCNNASFVVELCSSELLRCSFLSLLTHIHQLWQQWHLVRDHIIKQLTWVSVPYRRYLIQVSLRLQYVLALNAGHHLIRHDLSRSSLHLFDLLNGSELIHNLLSSHIFIRRLLDTS